jgi:5-methylcytosine-specific restriction enzyme A
MPLKPPTFRPSHLPTSTQIARDYDRRRGTAHERGYTNQLRSRMAAWKHRHPLCLGCSAVGRIQATEVCDHVVPHKGDSLLLWTESNWQPSCREHHNIIKQRLELLFANGTIPVESLKLDSPIAIRLSRELLMM